ncbi:hypothetical protein BIU98_08445 [Curtobacterium sp. MMLR14_010]|nr:hypothetical protein BIU98_08445 [Curtobacterium sp. MMLR14_010]
MSVHGSGSCTPGRGGCPGGKTAGDADGAADEGAADVGAGLDDDVEVDDAVLDDAALDGPALSGPVSGSVSTGDCAQPASRPDTTSTAATTAPAVVLVRSMGSSSWGTTGCPLPMSGRYGATVSTA